MTVRCPECRTRRATYASLLKHIEQSGHKLCNCGGYHYPHRPLSGYCHQHEQAGSRLASREGSSDEEMMDIAVEIAWSDPGRKSKSCPF